MPVLILNGTNLFDEFLINDVTYPGPYTGYQVFTDEGDDVVTITDSSLDAEVYGGAGNDTLVTDRGDDTIDGGNGNDVISTGRGADRIWGGGGDDIINAGNEADRVSGGNGNDVLNGAGGDDYLSGGKGHDTISGGSGDDIIFGNKGKNVLLGGVGNDTVNTGDHTSTVDGGEGDDLIVARLKKGADHILTGGIGADTFEFVYQNNKKSADVVITDFELGVDEFFIGGVDAQTWMDTNLSFAETFDLDLVNEVDGNTVLNIGSKDTITFEGISEVDFLAYYEDSGLALG